MSRPPPAGLPPSICLDIPTTWTPDEAVVVFELLDDLRDKVWAIYGPSIQAQCADNVSPSLDSPLLSLDPV